MQTSVASIDRILSVVAALHILANESGTFSAVDEALARFDLNYTDILKAKVTAEMIRESLQK